MDILSRVLTAKTIERSDKMDIYSVDFSYSMHSHHRAISWERLRELIRQGCTGLVYC